MPKLRFFLLDATYKVIAGKAAVYLYGRTLDGTQLCVRDSAVEPYFFVVPREGRDPTAEIQRLVVGDAKVARVERVKRNLIEQETSVLKVVVDLPSSVPALRDAIRNIPGVVDVLEADILFVRRYLIDKQLIPLTLIEADCERVTERSRVEVFEATHVRQASEDALTNPRILAVDIETYNPRGKSVDASRDPIIMVALYGPGLQKVITWKRVQDAPAFVEAVESEEAMLERMKQVIIDHKPDIIAGYYSDGFDLPYIKSRCDKYRIALDLSWDHTEMKLGKGERNQCQFTGLVHLDILRFIRLVIGRSMKTDSFSLDAVAEELLGERKKEVDIENLAKHWDANDASLAGFATYNLHDAKLTHDLVVKVLPNLVEMVRIVGMLPWDVARMSFSQLVEWYIIRQAFTANELVPNKPDRREQERRMLRRFKGAFVFEPKPGLYKDIVVFDYRSLYPSIIASHNISPGMLNCDDCEGKNVVPESDPNKPMWYCTRRKGFLSRIIEDIISRRGRIKQMLKDSKDPLLAARSEGLKVLANSFYGYLGFSAARWYCFECGEATTAWARYHIRDVMERAGKAGFPVIYGDTDSCFALRNGKDKKDAIAFLDNINESLPGMMELELENFYPAGLFVAAKATEGGAKKRYALIDEKGNLKIRGFEVVRRNVSDIARDTQESVLKIILGEGDFKKAQALVNDVVARLRANKVPLHDVIITTAITKPISTYESVGPHVAAAMRMKQRDIEVGPGTRIEYVVVKGKEKAVRDRVRLPDETTMDSYDGDYYVHHQVLPAVERIFEVVGINIDKATAHKDQVTLVGF
jgi:DNA polymerase elongation subunit (family B)